MLAQSCPSLTALIVEDDGIGIPPDDIDRHRTLQPGAQLHVYAAAGHGFNRDVDPRHHHPESAALAWRTAASA